MAFIKKIIILLIFSNIFLNGLKAKPQREANNGTTLFHLAKEKIINFIAKKKGYDKNYWVNLSDADHDINNLSFRIDQNGDVICNNDNQAVEVSITNERIFKQTKDAIYSELSIHPKIGTNSSNITKLPIKKYKNSSNVFFFNKNNNNSLSNSEAYLVCAKKNTNVVLVPKQNHEVEFIPGPWLVRVSISVYKDPLKPFGRVFRITIVDGINVLTNKQNSFFWFIPIKTFSEIYHFHMAAKDSKNGIYCNFERSLDNKSIKLHCPSWNTPYKLNTSNWMLFSVNLGMSIACATVIPQMDKIHIYNKLASKNVNNNSINDSDQYENSNDINNPNTNIEKAVKTVESITNYVRLIISGIIGISNIAYIIKETVKITNDLKEINTEFENASPIYEWTVTYPENNYQPDMALEKKKKKKFPEENSLNNFASQKGETIKKCQGIKKKKHKPTNEKQIERIIIGN
ncbi:conserved Plasmodium protein, unknown function [Plasmodium berghei]|uniref:Parasitophorous vacuolar protein 2 n=2 Tax=Plasmodium berghei TaxID=5821 RepID=A0A509AV32_PLABA|nr:parasitophorous vacuolar protein 2 [Plasmodium berghei ANKA]CXJ23155.1 conserved Plasmodium protein, unknown function [Plasmodium berghei]SCM26711.1 conserved Plasmodium protein, unknown function [Plasmodium berghei]SCN28597.1 conserved Plasmodium protein, unknown function [Plasmodium berghei]SCO62785.1 conserved Plasmodium protein, unknown function [Plasmodium berghei]SCO64345.1 conserved Plasmodium protein, unknown function [Plasmodium berghei]|eukprot:XP_034424241.1 parasitophorous vacuolar protein 2 [Plasmodium berghei ANKA]